MMSILYSIITWIFNLLPDSPFQTMVDGLVYKIDFLPQLNWFIPFDIMAVMTGTWVDCILVYYVFVLVKKIVMDYLVEKFLNAVTVIGQNFTVSG